MNTGGMGFRYGAPVYQPKKHSTKNLAKLIRDALILKGMYHLYQSGKSPAELAEFAKKFAKVPLNEQLKLRAEAAAVRKGKTTTAPLLTKYFGPFEDQSVLVCAGCKHEVRPEWVFCGTCGRRLV